MGMDFRVNEYGEIIRGEDDELVVLEQKYLKGVPLNIEVRKRIAAESQNVSVLEACFKDRAITIRRIVWSNPYLTSELRMEATRQKLLDKKSATNSKSSVKSTERANDLARYEDAMLRSGSEALSNSMRRKVARETRNEKVLWMCIRDTVKTVVTAASRNPILTPEMKSAISMREKEWEHLKQPKENIRSIESIETNSKDDNDSKGCLWFIIIAGILGALFGYLSGESWFPF